MVQEVQISSASSTDQRSRSYLNNRRRRIMATSSAPAPTAPSSTTASAIATTQQQPRKKSPSIFPRIVSGSIGSIVTALVVTPLEVVKVRQQTAPAAVSRIHHHRPCPSCGTIVFNNGLMECIISRKSVVPSNASASATASRMMMDHVYRPPRNNAVAAAASGTFPLLRQIYVKEGFAGIYAGLAPTLVMSVPNTVLYFTTYDELIGRLRRRNQQHQQEAWMPLVAGSSARLLASLVTAPLELIRTRQAISGTSGGVWADLATLVRTQGFPALFQGLAPTLWRDVPFSAIYWFSLEQFKLQWKERYNGTNGASSSPSPLQHAGQAFINGAAAGMIAAACTTPFDVVKTRHQAQLLGIQQQPAAAVAQQHPSAAAICHHNGARAVMHHPGAVVSTTNTQHKTIVGTLRQVVAEEGVAGLWRGNATRMYKVAPACAIMISCYETGKEFLKFDF
mmetsp:Transcript_14375/g.23725  ORF Transcript_14375/g.23725 Transcript_14375/m.23725 type:complete len:451 (-) Transcript_14375:169-1521(-)